MADTASSEPVHVTAEERVHPALQKLARAFISLARLRQREQAGEQTMPNEAPAPPENASPKGGEEACHEQ